MKIGFASLDWSAMTDDYGSPTPGGAGWYRTGLPAQGLNEFSNGEVEAVVGPNLEQAPDGTLAIMDHANNSELGYGCDVIVIQRWMESHAPDCIRKAQSTGQVVINDVDDWYQGLDTTNGAWIASHPKVNPNSNRDHYMKVLAASDALTVSTPYLAERLRSTNDHIIVVPNVIDFARWMQHDVTGDPVVGWVGATGYRSRDLETLRGILGPFCAKYKVPFHHSGHPRGGKPAADALGLSPDIRTSISPMKNIIQYPTLFDEFNIGIAPLSDVPFNRAKSYIKALEYAAAGIPFVAAEMPAYREFYEMGGGLTARRPSDWTKRLVQLLDPAERVAVAARGLTAARQRDIATNWVQWRDAYQTVLRTAQGG